MRRGALIGAVLVVVLAAGAVWIGPRAWLWWQLQRTFDPETPLAEQCGDDVPDTAERLTWTASDGQRLGAAVVGDPEARTGVVLRQGASQTLCHWLEWAEETAEATGTRVLLFDRRGRGSSPGDQRLVREPEDLSEAVELLRADGVDEVVLVASSMGNSVMFASLPLLEPAPCAVVSISPVLTSGDGSGRVDGTNPSPLPATTWVTWESRNAGVDQNAAHLAAQAAAQGQQVRELAVDTEDHSRQLVANHDEVRDFIVDAVASCAP